MTRLTVYKNPDGSGYLVDLQADINSHFRNPRGGAATAG